MTDPNDNIFTLSDEDYRSFIRSMKPREPNAALQRLFRNQSILERMQGMPAQQLTEESENDPRNPNIRKR